VASSITSSLPPIQRVSVSSSFRNLFDPQKRTSFVLREPRFNEKLVNSSHCGGFEFKFSTTVIVDFRVRG